VRRILIILGLLPVLLYASMEWQGKDCHFNAHLAKRVYCTKE
jgi:hypothetical protein